MRYVDLANWINKNAYSVDCDDELLIKYLFVLSYMHASMRKYFQSADVYDKFALFSATRFYYRIRNPKQYLIDPVTDAPKMEKISNILGYMNAVIDHNRVDFIQDEFYQGYLSPDEIQARFYDEDGEVTFSPVPIYETIEASLSDMLRIDSASTLRSVPSLIQDELKKIPFLTQPQYNNLYISCLITLLKYIKLMGANSRKFSSVLKRTVIPSYYKEIDINDIVVLYHLPSKCRGLVVVLCRRLKNILKKSLAEALATELPPDEIIRTIMYSDVSTFDKGEHDEYSE